MRVLVVGPSQTRSGLVAEYTVTMAGAYSAAGHEVTLGEFAELKVAAHPALAPSRRRGLVGRWLARDLAGGPDIVHLQLPPASQGPDLVSLWRVLWRVRRRGTLLVITHHGLDRDLRRFRWVKRAYHRAAMQAATVTQVATEQERDLLVRQLGAAPEDVLVRPRSAPALTEASETPAALALWDPTADDVPTTETSLDLRHRGLEVELVDEIAELAWGSVRARVTAPQLRLRDSTPDLLAVLAIAGCVLANDIPSARWLGAFLLLTVPGDMLRRAMGIPTASTAERVVYAVAGSITTLFAVAGVTQILFTLVGASRPLAEGPMVVATGTSLAVLVAGAHRHGAAPAEPLGPIPSAPAMLVAAISFAAVLVGTNRLDNGHGPGVLIAAFLSLCVALVYWTARTSIPKPDSSLLLVALSGAVLTSVSQRSNWLFGSDIHSEFASFTRASRVDAWVRVPGDAYSATLSLTSLPAMLHSLTRLTGSELLLVVHPMVAGILPLTGVVLLRHFGGHRLAICLVVPLMLDPRGFWHLAALARQDIALALFAALILLTLTGQGATRARSITTGIFGVGCVLAHYSTAYAAITVLFLATAFQYLVPLSIQSRRQVRLSFALPVSMLLTASLWYGVINGTAEETAESGTQWDLGLTERDGLIDSFLSTGGGPTPVTAPELFELVRRSGGPPAGDTTYPEEALRSFPAVDVPASTPEAALPHGEWANLGMTLVRLALYFVVAIASLVLGWCVIRTRWSVHSQPLAAGALAIACLMLLATARLSSNLPYNPERLLLQMSLVLPLALAVLAGGRESKVRTNVQRRAFQFGRGLGSAALLVVLGIGLLDTTGLRGWLFGGFAPNLQTSGAHIDHYFETDRDAAGAYWLKERLGARDYVYTDAYARLFLYDYPEIVDSGTRVSDLMTPYSIGQKGYVYASAQNVQSQRTVGVFKSYVSTYQFPITFLDAQRDRLYSNNGAVVYR